MNNDTIDSVTMYMITGAGWGISLSTVESVARIISLTVPVILSVLIYINNRKNHKRKGE